MYLPIGKFGTGWYEFVPGADNGHLRSDHDLDLTMTHSRS